jgi:DNA-binding PadR family transcriptional regulator
VALLSLPIGVPFGSIHRWRERGLASSRVRGRRVLPFVGKEAKLNHLILELLSTKTLASYEAFQIIRTVKGSRHIKNQVIDNRFQALDEGDWIRPIGTKKNRFNQDMKIYQLSPKSQNALIRNKVDIDEFQLEADDDLQEKMRELLSEYRKRKQAHDLNRS